MPIYEYICAGCGHELDALQKLSDELLVHCPHCGEPQLKRKLSAPRFRLKGSGWYETDFKNDKRRNIAESDSAPAEKKGDKSESKSESKPESKSDKKPEQKADKKPEAKPAAPAAKKKPDGGKAGGVA